MGTTIIKPLHAPMFASGIREDLYDMAKNVMMIGNKKYTMELFNENADYDTNSNKALNKYIKLNFLYALYKSTSESLGLFKNVMVGLPAKQWEKDSVVQQYKDALNISDSVVVSVNGISKEIYVEEILVVPEDMPSYYALETNNERFNGDRTLLVGIGSFNSNQYLFENDEYIDFESNEKGCLKVFQKMASEINAEYNTDIKTEQIYTILTKGLFINGERVPIASIIDEIGYEYAKDFHRTLKLRWDVKTIPFIELLGGGSIVLNKYIKEYIPHVELLPNAQTIAVKGMEELLRMC
jgi:hypothetical protein